MEQEEIPSLSSSSSSLPSPVTFNIVESASNSYNNTNNDDNVLIPIPHHHPTTSATSSSPRNNDTLSTTSTSPLEPLEVQEWTPPHMPLKFSMSKGFLVYVRIILPWVLLPALLLLIPLQNPHKHFYPGQLFFILYHIFLAGILFIKMKF